MSLDILTYRGFETVVMERDHDPGNAHPQAVQACSRYYER